MGFGAGVEVSAVNPAEALLASAPEGWMRTKLGFNATVKARLGWKGLKAEEYVPEGYVFLSTPNIKQRNIDFENVYYITEERYTESPEIALREGDVLLAKDGSTLGISNIVRKLPQPTTVNGSIAVIRPRQSLHSVYLNYYLQGYPFQFFVHLMKDGMGVPHLFQRDLRWFDVLVPPLPTQKAIADYLDEKTAAIDALIEKKRKLLDLLAEERAALINQAVTKGLDPTVPMKDSGIPWIGEVPAHWTVLLLRLVARIESGHTPSRQHTEYWVPEECVIPWFSLADVWQLRDGRQKYLGDTSESISELGMANSAARLLPAGTVVLSRTASVGYSGIMALPMATTQDFVNWVCGPRIISGYLLWLFRAMKPEFERLMMGSTHQTIYMPDVRQFRGPLPGINEQKEIALYLQQETKRLDAAADGISAQLDCLQEYRQALITAAVTGQLDIEAVA